MSEKKIFIVVGARPNFMKAAPLWREIKQYPEFQPVLIHTGQHYDHAMSDSFIQELDLPRPDIFLGVGSGTHAEQTARIMIKFEKVLYHDEADLVVVVGDVNSTIACALTAAKLCVPVAHVEAGLRSFDRSMPEEINRILTDRISDMLFTTCEDADHNLRNEGIPQEKIFFVGNLMIDSLLHYLNKVKDRNVWDRFDLDQAAISNRYALLTLHRPVNVDDPDMLQRIFRALGEAAEAIPVLFPIHPRTAKSIEKYELQAIFANRNILPIPPLSYLDFLALMAKASLVFTDSGGIQEETTILGVPCLTLRKNTERPITITQGTNRLVGNDLESLKKYTQEALKPKDTVSMIPRYWDGKAAGRIIKILQSNL